MAAKWSNSLDTNSTHNCTLVHTFTSLSCSVYRTRYVVCTIHSRHTCSLPGLPAKPNHHIPRQLCFSYHDTMAGFINFHPKNMMHLCNTKSMKVLLKYFYPILTSLTKKILLMPYKSYLTELNWTIPEQRPHNFLSKIYDSGHSDWRLMGGSSHPKCAAPRRKVASVAQPPPCYVPPPRRQVPRDMSFTKCLIILPASYGFEPLQCCYDLNTVILEYFNIKE